MTQAAFRDVAFKMDDFVGGLFFGGIQADALDGSCTETQDWVDANVKK